MTKIYRRHFSNQDLALLRMPMMHVRRMGMGMARGFMLMPVTMRALPRLHATVAVLVMTIVVLMRILVLQRVMGVFVAVAFHEVECDTREH